MTGARAVNIVVEGSCDAAVVERLVSDHGFAIQRTLVLRGKGAVGVKLGAYNAAARFGSWLVVRDLDRDAPCAAQLVRDLLPKPSAGMAFRIAVHAVEAWLLADAVGAAKFFRVKPHHVPNEPDALNDPKRALVALSRHSTSRAIREDMVPAEGTTAQIGPGYVARVMQFANEEWSWRRGLARSESLRRCVRRIGAWST